MKPFTGCKAKKTDEMYKLKIEKKNNFPIPEKKSKQKNVLICFLRTKCER